MSLWKPSPSYVYSLDLYEGLPSQGDFIRRRLLYFSTKWSSPLDRVDQDGSDLCRADVRLAHQLISGSSMTACHNPACTTQTIEETGSRFLAGVMNGANRSLDFPVAPSSQPIGPKLE